MKPPHPPTPTLDTKKTPEARTGGYTTKLREQGEALEAKDVHVGKRRWDKSPRKQIRTEVRGLRDKNIRRLVREAPHRGSQGLRKRERNCKRI